MVQGIVTGVYIFHNSVIFIVLVRRFGLACPSSSVLTGTEIEIVVYCTHIKEESDRIHSMPNRNLMKLKGTATLKSQHHYMTPRESKFTQFEILPIQENFNP